MKLHRLLSPLLAVALFGALSLSPVDAQSAAPARARFAVDLWSLAFASPTDGWVVGYRIPAGDGMQDARPLIRHWDGKAWRTTPSGFGSYGRLSSVAVVSPDDVWAVGEAFDPSGGAGSEVLALHWDGTSWTQVTMPTFPGQYNVFTDVSFASPTQGVIAGYYYTGEDVGTHISMVWTGSTWRQISGPRTSIYEIAALSPTDAWGVGSDSGSHTYAAHWDGTSWTRTSTPEAGFLSSVTAISTDDVWAVGHTPAPDEIVEHWDGRSWTVVEDGEPPGWNVLTAVSGSGSDDVWASGFNTTAGYVEHWNGHHWSAVSTPRTAGRMRDVASVGPHDAWAIGYYKVLMHWDGKTWSQYRHR